MPDLNTTQKQQAAVDVASTTTTTTTSTTSSGTTLEPGAREGSIRSKRRQGVSAERNAEFRARFRDVPPDEVVAAEYSASLQKEIPIHGKLYVSQRYLSFYSNLFGWVTSICVPFSDIISIEKKSKPLFVRSGIVVTTLHAKYYFVSFLQRDLAFNRLVSFLRNSQQEKPLSPEELLGIDEVFPYESESVFSDDEVTAAGAGGGTGEDLNIQRARSKSLSMEASSSSSSSSASTGSSANAAPAVPERVIGEPPITPLKTRSLPVKEERTVMSPAANDAAAAGSPGATTPASVPASSVSSSSASPRPDKPVDPKDAGYVSLKTPILDVILPAPIEVLYNKIFNPSDQFMRSFMRDNQRLLDLEFDPWGDVKGQECREYRYVMQLNAVMGPKSTRVLNKQRCITKDLPRAVVIENVSETPDVPSGDCFKTLNMYCLTYVDPTHTRFIMSGAIQFIKSTWIKSFIESHGTAGYVSFARDLERELRIDLEPKGSARDAAKAAALAEKEAAIAQAPATLPVAEEPETSPSGSLVAKVEGILLMLGIKVERAHIPRLGIVVLLVIMLIVQINALVHLGRTSRALGHLEVEAAVIRAACPNPVTAPNQRLELTAATVWADKVEALAARLEETEARLEKLYGKGDVPPSTK